MSENKYSNVAVALNDGTTKILTNAELFLCERYSAEKLNTQRSEYDCLIIELKEENERLKKQLEPIKEIYASYFQLFEGKNTFFSGNLNSKNSTLRMWNAIKKSMEI